MPYNILRYSLALIIALAISLAAGRATADPLLVFISAFAPGDDGAIHAFELQVDSGALKPLKRTADVEHPFFLALSPGGKFLYSIHAPGQFGGERMNKSRLTRSSVPRAS